MAFRMLNLRVVEDGDTQVSAKYPLIRLYDRPNQTLKMLIGTVEAFAGLDLTPSEVHAIASVVTVALNVPCATEGKADKDMSFPLSTIHLGEAHEVEARFWLSESDTVY